jgi:predicted  nucleic acid-binding Zn-ribbon protein
MGTLSMSSPAAPTASSSAADNYEAAFEQHHSYIREVLRRREQTFSRLETAISTQQRRIADLLERNSQLTSRIVDLDNRIEDERRRWRDAIESEKKAVQQFGS